MRHLPGYLCPSRMSLGCGKTLKIAALPALAPGHQKQDRKVGIKESLGKGENKGVKELPDQYFGSHVESKRALTPHSRAKSRGGPQARSQLQRADAGFQSTTQTSSEPLGLSSFSPALSLLPVRRGLRGWAQAEKGAAAFPSGARVSVGLGIAFTVAVCFAFFAFFLKWSLPCAPHPPASLGLRLSRNFSDKVSKKPQDPPPPPPSQNMRKGLNGKLGTRARARAPVCMCVCVPLCKWYVRARAAMGGAILTMKGTGFSPLPQRPYVAQARWGNSPGL